MMQSRESEGRRRAAALMIGEAACAFAAAAAVAYLCTNIKVDPQDRMGQISGIAAIELRYALLAVPLIVALIVTARWRGGAAFETTSRFACAAIAGLATGIVAGGVIVALRGTPYGLGGLIGDSRNIGLAAEELRRGGEASPVYPPLFMHLLAWYCDVAGIKAFYGLKHLQIAMTAMLAPCAYLAWRTMLRPTWALAIGVTAALPLIEAAPHKPYGELALIVFIPLLLRFLQVLRRAGERSPLELARCGVLFGLAFGVICLLYSGWFKWSVPGFAVAFAVVFPWRRAWREGLVLCVAAGVVFAVVAGPYLYGAFTHIDKMNDGFFYQDARIDPAYIAMWGGELPTSYLWPPRGEIGGVGFYTLVLFGGLSLAIALGRARTVVITLGSLIGGAYLLRFWYAHLMYKTKLVQLFPRTTHEIVYCLLAVCGFAVLFVIERVRRSAASDHPLRTASARIGAVCGLVLLFGSAGSAICDRYMPAKDIPMSFGILAWNAHHSTE